MTPRLTLEDFGALLVLLACLPLFFLPAIGEHFRTARQTFTPPAVATLPPDCWSMYGTPRFMGGVC